jgi:chromosome segregation ATPase
MLQSKAILEKQHETCIGLRHKIFELKPLEEKLSKEKITKIAEYNPELLKLAQLWLENTEGFVNIMTLYRENEYCIEEYIIRWENQRKALKTLLKNLQITFQERQRNVENMKSAIETFKETYNEIVKEGNENHPIKSQMETTVKCITEKLNTVAKKIKSVEYQLKINSGKLK